MDRFFRFLFQSPQRMLIFCGIFIFFGLILSGDLFRLIKLIRYKKNLEKKIETVYESKRMIKIKMKESSSQEFLEREAFHRFDMVKEGDIIFVFSQDI